MSGLWAVESKLVRAGPSIRIRRKRRRAAAAQIYDRRGEVASNLVNWISALMDEGAPDLPTRTFPLMLNRASTGSATIDAEAVPQPQPRPLITTPGEGWSQLI